MRGAFIYSIGALMLLTATSVPMAAQAKDNPASSKASTMSQKAPRHKFLKLPKLRLHHKKAAT